MKLNPTGPRPSFNPRNGKPWLLWQNPACHKFPVLNPDRNGKHAYTFTRTTLRCGLARVASWNGHSHTYRITSHWKANHKAKHSRHHYSFTA
jgi:hypothetical protein